MSKKLHEELGDWRSTATQVKSRIYADTIDGIQLKKSKPRFLKIGFAVAFATAIAAGSFFYLNEQNKPTPTSVEEQNDIENENDAIIGFRTFDDTFLKIAQYEEFYLSENFPNKEQARSNALSSAVTYYTLFNHLADHGVVWGESKRDIFRNSVNQALDYDLKTDSFKAYFEKLLSELNITREQYVDGYLLIKKEYDILYSEMNRTSIGLDVGFYDSTKYENIFLQEIGISRNYLNYLETFSSYHLTEIDPQPEFLFQENTGDEYYYQSNELNVGVNAEGEYVFVSPYIRWHSLPFHLYNYFTTIANEHYIHTLNRSNFKELYSIMKEKVKESGNLNAESIVEFLDIYENTVTWDFEYMPYAYNEIPTLSTENLRVHNDLSIKIAEYESYMTDEYFIPKSSAYYVADTTIINAYALFNYFQENYDYRWDESERNKARLEVEEALEKRLENPFEKIYFEQLLSDLSITKDDYITYYSLILKEAEVITAKVPEFTKVTPFYPEMTVLLYREAVDFSEEKSLKISDSKAITYEKNYLDVQPELPFEINENYPITVALNTDGEYVLDYNSFSTSMFTEQQQKAFDEIKKEHDLTNLRRSNIAYFIDFAEQLNTDGARELKEILLIVQRTFEN